MNETNRSATILVIDDEELLRQVLCDQLEDLGYRVLTAEHGRAGVEAIEKNHFDLVLTDLRMPVMGGLDVIKHSKRLAPELPIVVISGAGRVGDAVEALRLGAYDYLIKPLDGLDVLEHTVGKALDNARLVRENRVYQENLEQLVLERTQQLKQVNTRLEGVNLRLHGIVKSTQDFSACDKMSDICKRIMDEFAHHMGVSGGCLYFIEPGGLRCMHSLDTGRMGEFTPFPLQETSVFKRLLNTGEPLLVNALTDHGEPASEQWTGYRGGSLIAFPLLEKNGETMGMLILHNDAPGAFAEQDKEIGAILASYSCEAIRSIHATQTLRESEQRFRELADMLPLTVCETDSIGTITYANRKARESYGYSAEELRNGLTVFDITAPHERRKAAAETVRVMQGGEEPPAGAERLAMRKDGSTFPVLAYSTPILHNDKPIGMRSATVDISVMKRQQKQILHHAHFDSLTDLPNRFLALDRLTQLLKEAQRSGTHLAVIFLDLDDFKKVNDTLGHETGDKLLVRAARRLRDTIRDGDTVGRLGGDEFIVLLGGLVRATDARPVARNLLDQFRRPFQLDGRELMLTASLGIAVFPEDGGDPAELLRNADSAMYHSKGQGRNAFHYFTEDMNKRAIRRLLLEEQLLGALERGELDVKYQPLVEIPSRAIIGAEALLRWNNPTLGSVSPDEFIPVLEQTGQIIPVGQFVLTRALTMAAQWQRQQAFKIAVNISPRQFRDPRLLQHIEKTILKTGIAQGSIELEITEGVLMSGHASLDKALAELKKLGVGISMDDFGTGYSSLSYIRNYPFDTLKIDRSFVNDIADDPADRELVNTSITMARNLGLNVVAEGVETEEQFAILGDLKCGLAQGYLFSKAVDPEEISKMISAVTS